MTTCETSTGEEGPAAGCRFLPRLTHEGTHFRRRRVREILERRRYHGYLVGVDAVRAEPGPEESLYELWPAALQQIFNGCVCPSRCRKYS